MEKRSKPVGTVEQKNRGTEELRNRGTKEQKNKRTKEQKNKYWSCKISTMPRRGYLFAEKKINKAFLPRRGYP